MSSSTVESVYRIDSAGALAFGACALLTPRLVQRVYGVPAPSPEGVQMTRLWGGALCGLAATMAVVPGSSRRQVLQVLAAMNAVDAVAPLVTDGLTSRTRAMSSLTSAAFAALSAYGATARA